MKLKILITLTFFKPEKIMQIKYFNPHDNSKPSKLTNEGNETLLYVFITTFSKGFLEFTIFSPVIVKLPQPHITRIILPF